MTASTPPTLVGVSTPECDEEEAARPGRAYRFQPHLQFPLLANSVLRRLQRDSEKQSFFRPDFDYPADSESVALPVELRVRVVSIAARLESRIGMRMGACHHAYSPV